MTIREHIAIQKHRHIVRQTMQYPSQVEKYGSWYMRTVPSKSERDKDEKETGKFTAAFVQILCTGYNHACDFGAVTFLDPEFVEKWTRLVARGKATVDALNLDPEMKPGIMDSLAKGICANCDRSSAENDFLCEACRAA